MRPRVRVVADVPALAREAAERWRAAAEEAVVARERFAVALSGGATPQALHALLADPSEPYRATLPWGRTHVFFGDERNVPPDHAESNYGAARRSLLAHVPVPPEQVHRIRGEDPAEDAARAYDAELRALFDGPPAFDLLLLGLGEDGHVASLFPGSPALEERRRLVAAPWVPHLAAHRITLTLPALLAAREVTFLVAGARKRHALARALADDPGVPAARVRPVAGSVLWLVDRAAAGEVEVA